MANPFQLAAEAARRRSAGERIVDAALGVVVEDDRSIAVLPSVVRALRSHCNGTSADYAPPLGHAEFLEAVQRTLRDTEAVDAGAVTIATPGATGAIHLAISALLERGEALLVPAPAWPAYAQIAGAAGRRVVECNWLGPDGKPDVARLQIAIDASLRTQRKVVLCLCQPCDNPSGHSLNDIECRELTAMLVRASTQVEVAIVIDGVYRDFALRPSTLASHILAHAPQVCVAQTWSASKSLLQYGLRVGALLVRNAALWPRLPARLHCHPGAHWGCVTTLGQTAAARCLDGADLLPKVVRERSRVLRMLGARGAVFVSLAQASGIECTYHGGFFVGVRAQDPYTAAEKLRACGIYVTPLARLLRVSIASMSLDDIEPMVRAMASLATRPDYARSGAAVGLQ